MHTSASHKLPTAFPMYSYITLRYWGKHISQFCTEYIKYRDIW